MPPRPPPQYMSLGGPPRRGPPHPTSAPELGFAWTTDASALSFARLVQKMPGHKNKIILQLVAKHRCCAHYLATPLLLFRLGTATAACLRACCTPPGLENIAWLGGGGLELLPGCRARPPSRRPAPAHAQSTGGHLRPPVCLYLCVPEFFVLFFCCSSKSGRQRRRALSSRSAYTLSFAPLVIFCWACWVIFFCHDQPTKKRDQVR
jgi:hypothetical protein